MEKLVKKAKKGDAEAFIALMEQKKPKKDQSTSKPISPGVVTPTITTVVPDRSKKK